MSKFKKKQWVAALILVLSLVLIAAVSTSAAVGKNVLQENKQVSGQPDIDDTQIKNNPVQVGQAIIADEEPFIRCKEGEAVHNPAGKQIGVKFKKTDRALKNDNNKNEPQTKGGKP